MTIAASWDRRTIRQYWGLALLIALTGLALRLWLYRQTVNSDDILYFQLAHTYTADLTNTHAMRFMMVGLARFWIALLGVDATAFYAGIHTIALLSVLGIALLARQLTEPAAGVWTMLLCATSYIFLSTETLYLPDSFGTALVNLSCAAVLWSTRSKSWATEPSPALLRWVPWLGGLTFWAACSVREAFIIFLPALMVVLWLGEAGRRRNALLWMAGGLLVGTLLELALLKVWMGDPLVRIKALLLYPEQVAQSSIFQLPTWYEFFVRYPRMLYYTQSAELLFFVLGGAGVMVWMWRRRAEDQVKLTLWFFSFFFIAFALVRLDPPTPLMRAGIRYYLTALPLFYLAAAELFLLLWRSPGFWQRRGQPLLLLLMVAGLVWNLVSFARSPLPARNGQNAYILLPRVIQEDQARNNVPRHLFTFRGTVRVLQLYLTAESGWTLTGFTKKFNLDQGFAGGGYLLLDMRKFFGIGHLMLRGERVHPLLRMVENHPVVLRHHHEGVITDLLRLEQDPLVREIREVPGDWSRGWRLRAQEGREARLLPPGEALSLPPKGRLAHGEEPPPPEAHALPEDHLLEVILTVRTRPGKVSRASATLLRWPSGGGAAVSQPLGVIGADDLSSEVVLWSYLPQAAPGVGLVLEHREGEAMEVVSTRMRLMTRHERDRLEQRGGAW